MIPHSTPSCQTVASPAWQKALADAVRDPAELLRLVDLPDTYLPAARRAAAHFPLRVPRDFIARMKKGDANDPLLLQVLPLDRELEPTPGFVADPVGDANAMPIPGLLHKYHGRVLLITTAACGIHCRYCFRRHFPYAEANVSEQQLEQVLEYLQNEAGIDEVILSGGDPLSLSDSRLGKLVKKLESISQIKRLRIHTRQPVILPQRIDPAFLSWIRSTRLQVVMVIHANHAREISAEVKTALKMLRDENVTLLNQSVLLKGINDNTDALVNLHQALFDAGVLPYYLHQLDRVQGAAHFDVTDHHARTLHRELRSRLPGYLVPRLVREIAGEDFKLPVV